MTPSQHNPRESVPEETPEDISDRIRRARSHVAALRNALLSPAQSPGELMGCVPGLSQAAGCLSAIEHRLQAQPAMSKVVSIGHVRELRSLQSDLRSVQELIEHGAAFHRGWARLLGAAAVGYTSSGEAAPLAARGSLAMEG